MKAIVCFSGGHSSAVAAIETVGRYGKENVILLNHDISSKVEHADIKRFKQEVANYCGLPITYASAKNFEVLTPLEIARRKQMLGLRAGHRFCTSILKTEPFHKYLEQFERSDDIRIIYGFDAGEQNRIARRTFAIRQMGFKPEFPLAQWSVSITNTQTIKIQKPATYAVFKHANCIGCLKAGRQHWYCVFCIRPDIWEEAKETEQKLGYSIINGIYLSQLEPEFSIMRDAQKICPNDKDNSAAFWKRVREKIPEQTDFFSMPCDCSF